MKVNIPEDINDIQLSQFQSFVKIEQPDNYDVMRIFYNLNKDMVNGMQPDDVEFLVHTVSEILNTEVKELTPTFSINKIEFGFIPKLDDMTYGEHTDLIQYINDLDKIHLAMAVLFRPIKQKQFGKYLIENYQGSEVYGNLMKQMPLGAMLGAKVFFWNLTKDLLNYIPAYIKEEASQMPTQKSGEIIQLCTDLQKATSSSLTKSPNLMYTIV